MSRILGLLSLFIVALLPARLEAKPQLVPVRVLLPFRNSNS